MPQRVSDEAIVTAYRQFGSVKKAGAHLGINGGSVHERLQRLGLNRPINTWTAQQDDVLRSSFVDHRQAGTLGLLAKSLGRNITAIRARASTLRITSPNGYQKPRQGNWKYMSETDAAALFQRFKKSSLGVLAFCKKNQLASENFAVTMKRFFPDEFDLLKESRQPRQTMYRLGRALEYRVLHEGQKKGYFATRAPASKGKVDVVLIKSGLVLFVQCKRSGYVGPEEWNGLYKLARSVGALALVASTPTGRGTVYYRICGFKSGNNQQRQPWELYTLEANVEL